MARYSQNSAPPLRPEQRHPDRLRPPRSQGESFFNCMALSPIIQSAAVEVRIHCSAAVSTSLTSASRNRLTNSQLQRNILSGWIVPILGAYLLLTVADLASYLPDQDASGAHLVKNDVRADIRTASPTAQEGEALGLAGHRSDATVPPSASQPPGKLDVVGVRGSARLFSLNRPTTGSHSARRMPTPLARQPRIRPPSLRGVPRVAAAAIYRDRDAPGP